MLKLNLSQLKSDTKPLKSILLAHLNIYRSIKIQMYSKYPAHIFKYL